MKIGIALSGGGARGIAHLGVLKALGEMGIRPAVLSGTSAGAIAGAMTAAGYEPDEVLDIVQASKLFQYVRPALSRMGFLKIGKAEGLFLKYLCDNTFEGLKIPLTIAATDLMAGETVYFNSGPLCGAILASCCLPGIFEPVTHQGRLFVDGGVLNNMPIEPLEGSCDFIIGSHCNPYGGDAQSLTSMKSVMERSLQLAITHTSRARFEKCQILIEPPRLREFTVFDVRKARDLFHIGYEHTRRMQPDIEKALRLESIEERFE